MFLRTFFAVLLIGNLVGNGQEAPSDDSSANEAKEKQETISLSSLARQIGVALQDGESKTALALADAMVRQHRDDPNATLVAADVYLRTGKVESAVRFFDRYLESSPRGLPGLWQRGIALYFVGEYEKAAEQFEEHRKVNPYDVENAAWHFVCVAKAESAEEAKELVLPAPNDSRIPMLQVHDVRGYRNQREK
jgi:lipoprotein NlpI